MFRSRSIHRTLIVFWLFAVTANGHAADWPQFRGPGGQGQSPAVSPPLTWDDTENVAWTSPIAGRGWSSPVVQGNQIWLTTAVETKGTPEELREAIERVGAAVPSPQVAGQVTLKAICLDRTTGRVLHDVTLFQTDEPVVLCSVNSYASPTPVIQAGRLYCDFGAMGTACVDTGSGRVVWARHLVIEHQVGAGSSPVLYRDTLVLVRDGCDQQYVTALDQATGRTVWRTNRPPLDTPTAVYRKAFSTPLTFIHDGVEQMVIPGAQWIVSYDPASGKELWRVDTGSTFSNSSSPVYGQGLVFVCTAYGGPRMLAIRPDGRGNVSDTHVAWELQRSTPKRSSPLLVDDQLYIVSDNGIATCVAARTGDVQWTERLSGPHSASPIYAQGRVYFFGEEGTTTAVQPGTAFQKLAENRVSGKIMATPAFVDRVILLRTDTHLYCIGRD